MSAHESPVAVTKVAAVLDGAARTGVPCPPVRSLPPERDVEAAARRYDLDTRTILVEVGRRGMADGQEGVITDIAPDMTAHRTAV